MEQKLEGKVSYSESPAHAITKTLRARGYEIADHLGHVVNQPESRYWGMILGIIEPREPVRLFGLPIWSRRGLFIGRLAVDSEALGTKENTNWILEVYGRNNVKKLTEIIKEYSEAKKVDLQVRLERERSLEELYASDCDCL